MCHRSAMLGHAATTSSDSAPARDFDPNALPEVPPEERSSPVSPGWSVAGIALFAVLIVGLAYWQTHRDKAFDESGFAVER